MRAGWRSCKKENGVTTCRVTLGWCVRDSRGLYLAADGEWTPTREVLHLEHPPLELRRSYRERGLRLIHLVRSATMEEIRDNPVDDYYARLNRCYRVH